MCECDDCKLSARKKEIFNTIDGDISIGSKDIIKAFIEELMDLYLNASFEADIQEWYKSDLVRILKEHKIPYKEEIIKYYDIKEDN